MASPLFVSSNVKGRFFIAQIETKDYCQIKSPAEIGGAAPVAISAHADTAAGARDGMLPPVALIRHMCLGDSNVGNRSSL